MTNITRAWKVPVLVSPLLYTVSAAIYITLFGATYEYKCHHYHNWTCQLFNICCFAVYRTIISTHGSSNLCSLLAENTWYIDYMDPINISSIAILYGLITITHCVTSNTIMCMKYLINYILRTVPYILFIFWLSRITL